MVATASVKPDGFLAALPGTSAEVAARVRLAKNTTHRWLLRMAKEDLCHVGWMIPTKGRSMAYWVAGPAPKRPVDPPEVFRTARAKLYTPPPPKPPFVVHVRRDPLVAAFFGPAP